MVFMADEKVTFSPEQQAKIDELIREAQGRAAKEVRTQLETAQSEMTSLKEALRVAEEAAVAKKQSGGDPSDDKDEAKKLRSRIEEMERVSQSTKTELERLRQSANAKEKEAEDAKKVATNVRRQVAIQSAAQKVGFIDLDFVSKVTEDNVVWNQERGRFVVMNGQGGERLNSSYDPMTLEEYYTELAAEKPWMVRGDAKTGAGSAESQRSGLSTDGKYTVEQIFGPKSSAAFAQKCKHDTPKEYARLKEMAIAQGLI